MEKLLEKKKFHQERMKKLRQTILKLDILYTQIDNALHCHKFQYEKIDRQLAEMDGRLVRLKVHEPKIQFSQQFLDNFEKMPQDDKLLIITTLQELNEGLLQ